MSDTTRSVHTNFLHRLRDVAEDASLAWFKDKSDRRDESDAIIEAVATQICRDLLTEMEQELEPRLGEWFHNWMRKRGIEREARL